MQSQPKARARSQSTVSVTAVVTAILFGAAIIFSLSATIGKANADTNFVPELQPNPEYLPDEVVGIQMRALGNNDKPFADAGIEVTFRFASPRNKVSTGPLERFTNLFDSPAYRSMLNHATLEVGEAEIRNDQARVPVTIESNDGRRIVYLFALSLQSEEPYLNCWMTDSVVPLEITDSDNPVIM
ncbi:MAG: hypothetical protein KTR18_13005 [Acidiferrobacterales bacterium]|nr:hypothetical protein [Acidiferrobacterales bacterium]